MINEKEHHIIRKMIFTGTGHVNANPDLAILRLGVQTTDMDVTKAQAENARISQQVIESLRQLGVTDIKTYQYQIEKLYDYENGKQIDRGYSVRNILEIRTSNLGQVGTIIDTAVANGSNVVELISFDVSNPETYYQQALTLALQDAYQKAETIASSLRMAFNPVPILITENSAAPIPLNRTFIAKEAASTPIEPGTKEIQANITVEFAF
jgi:Uncharacterized conserved protein